MGSSTSDRIIALLEDMLVELRDIKESIDALHDKIGESEMSIVESICGPVGSNLKEVEDAIHEISRGISIDLPRDIGREISGSGGKTISDIVDGLNDIQGDNFDSITDLVNAIRK